MKGIGWLPLGSLEAEKNKKAMEIISEKKYRQHPDTLKYSTLMDSMNMVLAQNNAKIMNDVSLAAVELAWLRKILVTSCCPSTRTPPAL